MKTQVLVAIASILLSQQLLVVVASANDDNCTYGYNNSATESVSATTIRSLRTLYDGVTVLHDLMVNKKLALDDEGRLAGGEGG